MIEVILTKQDEQQYYYRVYNDSKLIEITSIDNNDNTLTESEARQKILDNHNNPSVVLDKSAKQKAWNDKLRTGYLSPATLTLMSLTTSVVDGSKILDNAVLLAIDVPAKIQAGMPLTTEYTLRDKNGAKIQGSNLGMAYNYLMEITKIGAKIKEINGLIFDAETQADLDAIDISFNWSEVI